MNINKELILMSEYLESIWSLDKDKTLAFLSEMFESANEIYKTYSGYPNKEMNEIFDARKAEFSNEFFYVYDSVCTLGMNLGMAGLSLATDNSLSFDDSYRKIMKNSSDKQCFKNAKLRNWKGSLDVAMLAQAKIQVPTYEGLHFREVTAPTFSNAVKPLTIAYADDKHGYGVKKLLEWACLTHIIQMIEYKNNLELVEDMKNLIKEVKDFHSNIPSGEPIYEENIENRLKSKLGQKLAKYVKENGIYIIQNKDEFDEKMKSLRELSLLEEDKVKRKNRP